MIRRQLQNHFNETSIQPIYGRYSYRLLNKTITKRGSQAHLSSLAAQLLLYLVLKYIYQRAKLITTRNERANLGDLTI